MKKTLVVMLALVLAIPAISYAGSAGSRWDLSIGGVVKFDMGWVNQQATSAYNGPRRDDGTGPNSNANKPNFYMNGTETGLSFFVKGPDGAGAHTSALIVADFLGGWSKGGTNGDFNVMIAKAGMDWANTSLDYGLFPGFSGMYTTFGGNQLMYGLMNQHGKGFPSTSQVTLTQRFNKNFSARIGAIDLSGPPGWSGGNASNYNSFTQTGYPGIEAEIAWTSDACGKIGPWGLGVKTTFTGGREKKWDTADGSSADSTADSWYWDIAAIVPIIPEKNGNKAGALLFDAIYWTSQDASPTVAPAPPHSGDIGDILGGTQNGFWTESYQRGSSWKAPVTGGPEAHLAYYFTNSVFTNVYYGYTKASMSQALIAGQGSLGVQNLSSFVVNVMWDINPAIRVGVEYDNLHARYSQAIDANSKKGTLESYRIGAMYFF